MIRAYEQSDLAFLEEQDMLAALEVQYYQDIDKEEIYTLEEENKSIGGILFFTYYSLWAEKTEPYHKIVINIIAKEEAKGELIAFATKWLSQKRKSEPEKNPCLSIWLEDRDYKELQLYMNHGFLEVLPTPCLKRDLTNTLPSYSVPEGMEIRKLAFTPEEVAVYIEATKEANKGTADSINELWFRSGEQTFSIYVLVDGNRIVSSASAWKIDEKRAAIENIFTVPEYRNRNLAKAVIAYVLEKESEAGYDMATLSMRGDNRPASRLYQSLGFELFYNQVELRYEC